MVTPSRHALQMVVVQQLKALPLGRRRPPCRRWPLVTAAAMAQQGAATPLLRCCRSSSFLYVPVDQRDSPNRC